MTPDEVKRRLQEVGWTAQQTQMASLDALGASKVLEMGEAIERAVQGKINKVKGLLLATDRRLVFVNQGLIKTQSESFRYDRISSVQYESGFMHTTISLLIDSRTLKIEGIINAAGASFADYVRQRVDQRTQPAPAAAPVDVAGQLERLADLRERGILSDEEFQAQKRKLLDL